MRSSLHRAVLFRRSQLLNKMRVVGDRPEDRDLILERKVETFVSSPPPDQLWGSE
jgi:hypothetical protein